MTKPQVIVESLGFAEGPRWHDGRLWFSDMGTARVLTVDIEGRLEEVVHVPARPSGLGWLPDGRLLVVSMQDRRLLSLSDGQLVEHADLTPLVTGDCNDMVVDAKGNAYVGNAGFDLRERPLRPRPAQIVLVTPEGRPRVVDDRVMFPNGSVVTPDGKTLIVAETFGNRLSAFDIEDDGSLLNRRSWAELPGASPDGICLDAEGAVWVADASGRSCLRVVEGGGIVERIDVSPRNCYACMLGGPDGRTLFLCTAEAYSGDAIRRRTGAIEGLEVAVPHAGWP